MDIAYRDDAKITVEVAIDLYKRSTLGERRPIDRPDIFEGMLNNANLTITAWLLATGWAFYTGSDLVGYALGVPLALVAALVSTTHFCIASLIYNTLFR